MSYERSFTDELIPQTERETQLARKAWQDGLNWLANNQTATLGEVRDEKNRLYPLPRTPRPRVINDPCSMSEWTWRDGEAVWRHKLTRGDLTNWHTPGQNEHLVLNADRIKLLADLLANPTEAVEEKA